MCALELSACSLLDFRLGSQVPCLEFADADHAYVSNASTVRFGNVSANYQDNRYWTMFKLPMFGCNDACKLSCAGCSLIGVVCC